jgi:arabinofuranosyltransferase
MPAKFRSSKFRSVQEGKLLGLEFYEILLIFIGLLLVFKNKWVCDDGYIYFRYVDNFVIHKIGLVFNAHEYVEGFSGVLWAFVLSGIRFFVRVISLRHIVFVLGFGLALITFYKLARVNHRMICAARGNSDKARKGLLLNFSLPLALAISTRVIPEYFTSGLETPFVMLYAVLVATQILLPSENILYLGILIGAGPLVRAELAIFSVCLFLHFLLFVRKKGAVKVLLIAAVPNLAYLIFRVWYYAGLLPNTFFTKASSGANIKQGFNYFLDLIKAYRTHIVFILFLLATLAAIQKARRPMTRNRIFLAFVILMFSAYVIWVGGDFMHGRFWLPVLMMLYAGFSGLGEPFFASFVKRRNIRPLPQKIFSLLLVLLVVLVIMPMRSVSTGQKWFEGIMNEREWFLEFDGRDLSDWNFEPRNIMVKQAAILKTISQKLNMPLSAAHSMIGYLGYFAGPRVTIIDRLGLTDAVGSRVRLYRRGYPGHEKWVPFPYLVWRRSTFWLTPFDPYNNLFSLVPQLDPLTDFDPALLSGLGRIYKKDIQKKADEAILRILALENLDPNLVFFIKKLAEPYPDLDPDIKQRIEDQYERSAKGKASWELWLKHYEKDLETIQTQITNKHKFFQNIGLAFKTLTIRFDYPP